MTTTIRTRAAKGFTLLELMVAMAITAIIVTLLVSITGIATDTWTRGRSEVRAARQAKAMLDAMAKDFESMVSRRSNNYEWFYATMKPVDNAPKVSTEQAGAPTAAEMIFTTAATDRYGGQVGSQFPSNVGDVSAVVYRLAYQNPIDTNTNKDTWTFALYRLLINPDETFRDILGTEDLSTKLGSLSSKAIQRQNFVCENIHQFTVTFLVEVTETSGGGNAGVPKTVRLVMDSEKSNGEFRLRGTGIQTNLSPPSGTTLEQIQAGRLTGVELSLSVLSDVGLARISSGQGLRPADYAGNSYHYTRIVEVPSM